MAISNTEIQVSGNDVVGVAVVYGPVGSSGLELYAARVGEALSHPTMNSSPMRRRLLEQARRRTS
jgi:hypothetical protein